MEIKRATEIVLCEFLKDKLPDLLFFPSKGGSATENTDFPDPPFAAVMCEPSEKMIAYEDTNILHGTVIWVVRWQQENVATHSDNFKRIYDALGSFRTFTHPGYGIHIHGLDISGTDDFIDNERSAHGDIIDFVIGVTAQPQTV
jgi:hypothetical protein